MVIQQLKITNFRVISDIDLSFGSTVNFIVGNNGSGKTSILEALYLCGRGKTFRHAEAGPFIRHDCDNTQVIVSLFADDKAQLLGVERNKKNIIARLNGESIAKRSDLARALPLQLITSQSQLLLEGDPQIRRLFIDMAMFHVEPSYAQLWKDYRQTLKQRNAALRLKEVAAVKNWDAVIARLGEQIHQLRKPVLQRITDKSNQILLAWGLDDVIEFRYHKGWKSEQTLLETLALKFEVDMSLGYTSVGPHRADLKVLTHAEKSGKKLSRGQLKMVVFALFFALLAILKKDDLAMPTLLIDDLFAELDATNATKVLTAIREMAIQCVVSCIALDQQYIMDNDKVFHVEHGGLMEQLE